MALASRAYRAAFAAAWLFAVLIAAEPVFGQEAFKQLRTEVSNLEGRLEETQKKLAEADRKVADNTRAQENAAKDAAKLAQLKKEGVTLRRDAVTARDAHENSRRELAGKQGELRVAASKYAAEQLAAKGDANTRVAEITKAIEAWSEALGELPEVPAMRDTSGLDDETARATIKGDKDRLKSFDKWAGNEQERVKVELDRADKLVNGEDQLKGADNAKKMVESAGKLKETLKLRQKGVEKLREDAAKALKKLD